MGRDRALRFARIGAAVFGTAAVAMFGGSCASATAIHECTDGIDNDRDGLYDENDPGCVALLFHESPDPDIPACADGVDNDHDGMIDFADPGCFNLADGDEVDEPQPACRDGIDNDGDGLIDYPEDPGCFLGLENSEADDCPDGPGCPACANNIDDDGDGLVDFPDDPGCDAAHDRDEVHGFPSNCGLTAPVHDLPASGTYAGTIRGDDTNDLISPQCGGAGAEEVYHLDFDRARALWVTTDFPETTLDTVLYLRGACRDPETELACSDDLPDGTPTSALTLERIPPGSYDLVVDSYRSNRDGDYRMDVQLYTALHEICDPAAPDCLPGQLCRYLDDDAAEPTCEYPECSDGFDNDGDGLIDYPEEPGCDKPDDNDEEDDCPNGAGCPECSNGSDDDGDSVADYPEDPGCSTAADDFEIDPCPGLGEVERAHFGAFTGTTSGPSHFRPSCGFGSSPEDVYGLVVDRNLLSMTFSTVGSSFDTVLSVRHGACTGTELACKDGGNRGETVTVEQPKQGAYYIFVDGDFDSGNYQLSITGVIPAGESCDPATPALACEDGYHCDGSSRICSRAACADRLDNDGDGLVDFPMEPGCASASDNDEQDDCPSGPTCPACSNQLDDDGDGDIDRGDVGCSFAADPDEKDCDEESGPVARITVPETHGDTTGAGNDFAGKCGGVSGNDAVYSLRVPSPLTRLRMDTAGSEFNTILYFRGANSCTGEEYACNNNHQDVPNGASLIELTDVDPGVYFLFVDGFGVGDEFTLNVYGEIASGGSCDPADLETGLFSCEPGTQCQDGVCAPAACNDDVDDDGDGFAGYPDDPGCENASDDDESDDCPDGPGCPVCSNQSDDDGDGLIDYGADPGCSYAADHLEVDPCSEETDVLVLTDAGANGRTPVASAGSNFRGSCHSSTRSTEDVYAYRNQRALDALTFSTVGSGETVLYARTADCSDTANEVACENDSGGEEIVIDEPVEGYYYVFVDGDYRSAVDYELRVSGILAAGSSCDAADTQFVCGPGHACNDGQCAPARCINGIDDDGDGRIDAADPGCTASNDNSEAPDPDPIPLCADGLDNDGDGEVDYPADLGCSRASDDDEENCPGESDDLISIVDATTEGDTAFATDDFEPYCVGNSTAPDIAHEIYFPGDLETLEVDTKQSMYDTVLSMKTQCELDDVACNDDSGGAQSRIRRTDVPGGIYHFIVDGYASHSGIYFLTVKAVVKAGAACDEAQVAAGIASCAEGTSCTSGVCAPEGR